MINDGAATGHPNRLALPYPLPNVGDDIGGATIIGVHQSVRTPHIGWVLTVYEGNYCSRFVNLYTGRGGFQTIYRTRESAFSDFDRLD